MKLLIVCLFILPSVASAKMAELSAFKAAYPNAKALHNCKTCHEAGSKLNYYGVDYQAKGKDFKVLEPLDSDGDGAANIAEINAGTNPGDKTSHP